MRIPGRVLDNTPTPFPEGVYLGTLKSVEGKWNEEKTRFNLNLTFRDITVIEGNSEPGARPYRCRLAVVWDDASLVDIESFDENTPFIMERSAMLLGRLALALDAVKRDAEGNADLDMDGFIQQLEEGAYLDEVVKFEVRHREWTSKDKKRKGVSDDPSYFDSPYVADDDEAEAEAEPEPEPEDEEPAPPKRKPSSLRRR